MRNVVMLLGVMFLFMSCETNDPIRSVSVSNAETLQQAIQAAQPGDEIVMEAGVWKDVQIQFVARGEANRPIILRAEEPGAVSLEGLSSLSLAGEYLIVDGLYFKNGHTPANSVIQFRMDKDNLANHCEVTNTVIEDYTQPNRYDPDHWVEFYGQHNALTHSYLAGKSNQGPTVRVYFNGNQNIRNYHQISNNHFGPRPRKGGPKAETMQIGDSYTSMTPSYVQVSNNFFERCNGEVEIISSKSNFNEFRNNIFFECEGSLVMRHGNYCVVDGNLFIGDEKSQFNGGIRVINTGHWITNNYFYQLKGDEFRAALAIMNGIPKSPLNRYNQVTDAVVAYNTWVDCETPWQFSVGANMKKNDVLPASEIRSARPIRTILANNLITNHWADPAPFKAYDKVDGIQFENNVIDNQGQGKVPYKGVASASLELLELSSWLYIPAIGSYASLSDTYAGFGFDAIKTDVFGNKRSAKNNVGAALIHGANVRPEIIRSNYGPTWFHAEPESVVPEIHYVSDGSGELLSAVDSAKSGDIIELVAQNYELSSPIAIDKVLTIRQGKGSSKATIRYMGEAGSPLFEMNPKGRLKLENVTLIGEQTNLAFATLPQDMSAAYGLEILQSEISGFGKVLHAYRGSFADTISFSNTTMANCESGLVLAAETDDKGDYNAEFLNVVNCRFNSIDQNVINFYRGGYDESTIGGNLLLKGNTFQNCGKSEKSKILIKTRGIINVDIVDNTFANNPVELVALLWGEKDNRHSGNKFARSGKIRVDQYLKQKLVY
jgi:poly(beta-D-mannuronate) lyase